ncbi:hypothetical protein CEXT_443871 [Caerostris extrusa]|uniref:Uncharacterized protein n=1 Tax=Caerostris extrusa TaxID=172846 RepID=A0AAV4N5A0_CAEEX|nr:hypothetical protein CEXT_443871 [Caerostris extrusa]
MKLSGAADIATAGDSFDPRTDRYKCMKAFSRHAIPSGVKFHAVDTFSQEPETYDALRVHEGSGEGLPYTPPSQLWKQLVRDDVSHSHPEFHRKGPSR